MDYGLNNERLENALREAMQAFSDRFCEEMDLYQSHDEELVLFQGFGVRLNFGEGQSMDVCVSNVYLNEDEDSDEEDEF